MPRKLLLSLVLVVATTVGCAGATETDLLGPAPSTNDTSTAPAENSSSGSSTSGSKDKPSKPAPSDPGEEETSPPNDPNDQPQAPTCVAEVEGNNNEFEANSLVSCVTGKLANSRDVDFYRITAPDDAQTMIIKHTEKDGRVVYRVTEEDGIPIFGTDRELDEDDEPAIFPITPGASYLVRVSTGGNGNNGGGVYEVDVAFTP